MSNITPTPRRAACALLAFGLLSLAPVHAQTPMPVSGSGTANRLPKWTGTSTQGNSVIAETSGRIGIGIDSPQTKLHIGDGQARIDRSLNPASLLLYRTGLKSFMLGLNASGANNGEFFISDLGTATTGVGTRRLTINNTGNVGIGVTVPAYKLSVGGVIQSTTGGFRFPDGTVQTTAATGGGGGLTAVAHNTTLVGAGTSASPLGIAVPLTLSATSGTTFRGINSGNIGVYGSGGTVGLHGHSASGTGLYATGGTIGVHGTTSSGTGLAGKFEGSVTISDQLSAWRIMLGDPYDGTSNPYFTEIYAGSVKAQSSLSDPAVEGVVLESNGPGVRGTSEDGFGVEAFGRGGSGSGGIYGSGGSYAGYFAGDVYIAGQLQFPEAFAKIDHPTDPENKTLALASVNSPEMLSTYGGNAILDTAGEAVVDLPAYVGALNRDFRYQLTAIGASAPGLYVAEKVTGNRFKIAGGEPGLEVSWQVTGVRQDAWATKNPVAVEAAKPEPERGFYLHPEAFDQPEEKGVEWARHPELKKRQKADREKRQAVSKP